MEEALRAVCSRAGDLHQLPLHPARPGRPPRRMRAARDRPFGPVRPLAGPKVDFQVALTALLADAPANLAEAIFKNPVVAFWANHISQTHRGWVRLLLFASLALGRAGFLGPGGPIVPPVLFFIVLSRRGKAFTGRCTQVGCSLCARSPTAGTRCCSFCSGTFHKIGQQPLAKNGPATGEAPKALAARAPRTKRRLELLILVLVLLY